MSVLVLDWSDTYSLFFWFNLLGDNVNDCIGSWLTWYSRWDDHPLLIQYLTNSERERFLEDAIASSLSLSISESLINMAFWRFSAFFHLPLDIFLNFIYYLRITDYRVAAAKSGWIWKTPQSPLKANSQNKLIN